MDISAQGIDLIKDFEGFSATAYHCPAGKLTIGYGHVIGQDQIINQPITTEQAEELLQGDVAPIVEAFKKILRVPVTQNQFDALVSLAYNIGIQAFEKSTLLRLLNAGRADRAANEFQRWCYAGGNILPGLARRRAAEAALFLQAQN